MDSDKNVMYIFSFIYIYLKLKLGCILWQWRILSTPWTCSSPRWIHKWNFREMYDGIEEGCQFISFDKIFHAPYTIVKRFESTPHWRHALGTLEEPQWARLLHFVAIPPINYLMGGLEFSLLLQKKTNNTGPNGMIKINTMKINAFPERVVKSLSIMK